MTTERTEPGTASTDVARALRVLAQDIFRSLHETGDVPDGALVALLSPDCRAEFVSGFKTFDGLVTAHTSASETLRRAQLAAAFGAVAAAQNSLAWVACARNVLAVQLPTAGFSLSADGVRS